MARNDPQFGERVEPPKPEPVLTPEAASQKKDADSRLGLALVIVLPLLIPVNMLVWHAAIVALWQ